MGTTAEIITISSTEQISEIANKESPTRMLLTKGQHQVSTSLLSNLETNETNDQTFESIPFRDTVSTNQCVSLDAEQISWGDMLLPTESETQGSYLVEAGHTPISPDDFCSVSYTGVIDLAAREVSPSNKLAENREIPTTKKRKQKKKKKKIK